MTDTAAASNDLPLDRLEAWLRGHVEGFRGPVAAERFAGGQSNPSYRLDAASGQYVLRRKPPGPLLPSAHAVDREFRVMRALAGTQVPVPRVHALCEDDAVIGSAFYVMEFLDGRIFWDQRLPEIADPAERGAMFDSMNAVIAALHNVDYDGGRARRFRPSRQLHGPPDRALEPAVPRLRDRDDRGDGPADRLAAAAHPAGERAGDRPRRLPHGQSGVSQDRASASSACSTGNSRRSATRSPISPITS